MQDIYDKLKSGRQKTKKSYLRKREYSEILHNALQNPSLNTNLPAIIQEKDSRDQDFHKRFTKISKIMDIFLK